MTESDIEQAWTEYLRGIAGNAGIVDHVSFAVMRRLAITDAFTNDRHFKTAGFNALF
jgi:predicted nucleic acid-binding protein